MSYKIGYVGMTTDERERKRHWANTPRGKKVYSTWKVRESNLTYKEALEKEEEIAEEENRDYSGGGDKKHGAVYIVYTFDY